MTVKAKQNFSMQCPVFIQDHPCLTLAHGGGGRLSHRLLETIILPILMDSRDQLHDGYTMRLQAERQAFTTDSYVVDPIIFPGGNIGRLAVLGTVNDLAMCGARAEYMSVGLIAEEGLEMDTFVMILESMREAADQAGVRIVTGDTKVVDRGKADRLFINTSGIGSVIHDRQIAPTSIEVGDLLIVSGDLGRHGIAIMSQRHGLQFESPIKSDCASLFPQVSALLHSNIKIHCLRDLTRGGLASVTHEIATASGCLLTLEEQSFPVTEEIAGACEILGLDPIHIACEGRFLAIVPADQSMTVLEILSNHSPGVAPACIGKVSERREKGTVIIRGMLGVDRPMVLPSGEQLPRIC